MRNDAGGVDSSDSILQFKKPYRSPRYPDNEFRPEFLDYLVEPIIKIRKRFAPIGGGAETKRHISPFVFHH